jgi:uncharacterized membrane protein
MSNTPLQDQVSQSNRVADENILAVAQLQDQAAQRRGWSEHVADAVADVAGRELTIVLHLLVLAFWVLVNSGLTPIAPFDPFPYTMLSNMAGVEAIFLTLFILASQKRLTADATRRAHLDLQVNLLAEQEMTLVLRMLRDISAHLGLRDTIDSEKFKELARRTDVSQLAEQVEKRAVR